MSSSGGCDGGVVPAEDLIKIEPIQAEDEEQVIAFLKETFFKDEPLNASLDLGDCPPLEHFCRKGLSSGYSFKALDGGGQLVGVSLNTLLTRPPANDEDGARVEAAIDDAIYKSHEKFYKIIQISTYAFDRVDLFGRYTLLDTILQAEVWSVAPSHRGRGIAQKMTKAVIEEAKKQKIPLFYCQCSSAFTARVVAGLDFQEVFSIQYCHYKVDGVQLLDPKPPHDHLKIYIKWIDAEWRNFL